MVTINTSKKPSLFSISFTRLNILHITGENLVFPRTHIHSYPNNLLQVKSVSKESVFHSQLLSWQVAFCYYKEKINFCCVLTTPFGEGVRRHGISDRSQAKRPTASHFLIHGESLIYPPPATRLHSDP